MSNKPNEQEEKVITQPAAADTFEENYIDENILADSGNKFKEFVKKFMKRKTAVVAFIIMVFLLIIALVGPHIAPYDPKAFDYDNVLSPPTGSARTTSGRIFSAAFWPAPPSPWGWPSARSSWALCWGPCWDCWPATTAGGLRCW